MVRMSSLRNYPVICRDKQVGLLQNICLDAAQKRVYALIVSCGICGKRVVLPEDIVSLSNGFILVNQVRRYRRSFETASSTFVRDSTGLLVGYVTDYAIEESRMQVAALEMRTGYLNRTNKYWVFTYTQTQSKELCIPACMGSELIGLKEGIDTCVCPP